MKEILAFHMQGCPYCANAFRAIDELMTENPAYKSIKIDWHDDANAQDLYPTHPYNYCPNMWFDTELAYEAKPGETYEQTKSFIKAVFDKAL